MGMKQLITKLLNFATETFLQDNEILDLCPARSSYLRGRRCLFSLACPSFTALKMNFSVKDYFSKCDQIRSYPYWINSQWKTPFFVHCLQWWCHNINSSIWHTIWHSCFFTLTSLASYLFLLVWLKLILNLIWFWSIGTGWLRINADSICD